MINDNKIKNLIRKIRNECNEYLDYINKYNECAYSDRMIENIISNLNKLKVIHNSRFESNNIKNYKNKKGQYR